MKSNSKIIGAGILTATAASLCCITPVLALISGTSGIASAFSWMEPFRPYLIGLTIAVLGFAWYQKLKLRKKDEIVCDCPEDKPSFWQGKTFLAIVTVLSLLLMAFPKYSHIFYPKAERKEIVIVDKNNIQQVEFKIKGMTCEACTEHINLALSKVPGILEYKTEYKAGSSIVKFDNSKINQDSIANAINESGYKVTNIQN
jgi:copper chaperone CopZ